MSKAGLSSNQDSNEFIEAALQKSKRFIFLGFFVNVLHRFCCLCKLSFGNIIDAIHKMQKCEAVIRALNFYFNYKNP